MTMFGDKRRIMSTFPDGVNIADEFKSFEPVQTYEHVRTHTHIIRTFPSSAAK